MFAFRNPVISVSQFLDQRGNIAFKVFLNFGGREPAPDLKEKYNQLIETFAKPENKAILEF